MKTNLIKSFIVIIAALIGATTALTRAHAQVFSSTTPLTTLVTTKNTGEKPQSKVWQYNGKWYAVFPNSSGTFIWRLDGTTWTSILKISNNSTTKADCKPIGNLCHIFLWKKADSPSQLVSVEYVASNATYKLWTTRTSTVSITLDVGTETGTIDIDGIGRMWGASDGSVDIRVRWSDPPYSVWSAPQILASGAKEDDICVVVALPVQHQIGVFWSNQNTKRFGFRTHNDGADPLSWSADENPASQSALEVGFGFSDDHMNVKIASDGTLYCASKTSYDTPGYPKLILLKRTPSGSWDNIYEVAQTGTRGIVLLNEETQKLKYIYTSLEDGGDILCKESSTTNISFSATPEVLITGGLWNNSTSSKDNFTNETVILASTLTSVVGVLAKDEKKAPLPSDVTLISPADSATTDPLTTTLAWAAAENATGYQAQVSTAWDFSTLVVNATSSSTSVALSNLNPLTTYYWRVRGTNGTGSGNWSTTRSFNTSQIATSVPVLVSPANQSSNLSSQVTFNWLASPYASSYELELSSLSDSTVISETTTATSLAIDSLQPNAGYAWRVRAGNATGLSDWSATWTFTTAPLPPSAPTLLVPADLAIDVDNNATLSWDVVAGAASYHAQISLSSTFTSIYLDKNNLTTTSTSASLQYATTYYWRVAASNAGGEGSWSEVRSFKTRNSLNQLVGYWKFDEGNGTIVSDASGFANNGATKNSPVWTTGRTGSGLLLNGSNQLVLVPDASSLDLRDGVTVSAWVKPEKKSSQHIVSKGEPGVADGYELALLSTGKVSFRVNQKTSTTLKVNSKGLYPATGTTWVHIAATYNGTVMKLYINGVLDKSTTFTPATPINTNDLPLALGAEHNISSLFKGTLDEVRVYNYALTASEISAVYVAAPSGARIAATESVSQEESLTTFEPKISVYPNPVVNRIIVETAGMTNHTVSVLITDMYGRIYKKETVQGTLIEYSTDDLNMNTGFYIIKITTARSSKTMMFQKK